jgi:hypothetical protein
MQFSDTATLTGLIQDCEQQLFGDQGFGQISGNANRLKQFTNLLNRALDRYVGIALQNDGGWEFDDSNYTDYPIGTSSITSGQQDYPLTVEHMMIIGVEILNASSQWSSLYEIQDRDFLRSGVSPSNYRSGATGIPTEYRKVANSLFLYPTPNFTQAASLKVHFQRPPSYFTYTDTTKVPGFAAIQHPYLSTYASWLYARSKQMPIKNDLAVDVRRWEEVEIPLFYATRSKDTETIIRPRNRTRSSR